VFCFAHFVFALLDIEAQLAGFSFDISIGSGSGAYLHAASGFAFLSPPRFNMMNTKRNSGHNKNKLANLGSNFVCSLFLFAWIVIATRV